MESGLAPDLRVLVVGHAATRSGSPIVLLNVVRWMRKHTNWTVDVVFREGGALLPEFQPARVLRQPRTVRRRPFPRDGRGFEVTLTNPEVVDGARYDVIYANSTLALHAIQSPQAPVVLHIHELPWACRLTLPGEPREWLSVAKEFIAPSAAVEQMLTSWNLGPTTVVYEIVDTDRPEPDLPETPPIVLGCGTPEPRKGTDMFLQLAQIYRRQHEREARFIWVGDGGQVADVREENTKAGSPIELVPHTADPWPWFERASVFALTSREDPFPLVALEAMLARRPVVCFDNAGGIPEIAARGAGVVVPYADVSAMTDEIARLLVDADTCRQLGDTGRRLVQQTCSIGTGSPRVAEILARVAHER